MPIRVSEIFDLVGYKLRGVCSCGRVDSILHCVKCGSTSVIMLKRLSKGNTVLLQDGSRVPDRVFTCKQCGANFPESTCFRTCEAMPLSWHRESELVERKREKSPEKLQEWQLDTLRAIAKKNPKHAELIKAKLGSSLDERSVASNDSEVTKLFEKPKIDDEEDKS